MLEIKNLYVNDAVKDFCLTVRESARHLIRGANGSGKTSFAQAIIGNPDYEIKSGGIIFDGRDITKIPTAERARMGIFLGAQNAPEIPGLAVMTFLKHSFSAHYENIPMGEFMKKLKAAQIKLDIPDDWLGRSVNAGFSGGEKKRLMFLHLMLLEPKLAVLDEPDSGADEATRRKFAEIIDGMKNTTFLIISHLDVFFNPTATTTIDNRQSL